MPNKKGRRFWRKNFWTKETSSGGSEYRTSSKVLFTILPILLAALLYKMLIVIEDLEQGTEIIVAMAYGVGVLLLVVILLMIIISIIEYLNKFEQ